MGFGDASAKDKKAAAASAKADAAKKAAEDASWEDNDKGTKKKADRKADADAKADAKLQAKKEKEELEAAENEANAKVKGASKAPQKLTQAEIARRQMLAAMSKPAPSKKKDVVAQPSVEANTNREKDSVDASGIDAAVSALEEKGGKAEKMTYKQFEARELQKIKDDNPGLKHDQAKDKCFKLW
eukprot:CAMPEP_0178446410 /NCGR_PEP_ID=MMETSP0689_2-20121128/40786_1 /TAXON_ID=160604 /ORGANISM="Amphidinium massartii, Strain CS-259" /LENGTH=184 /DNA_ID=CAMNT_0020071227 /DNA_START=97 /DNA_END=648 /DNA_ORIENTATION=+